ncbi:ECF RNA polymerase sigma factor SigW [Posidoniimonas polymericola]|uniref:ECF RNA polymerase sigma factor SigW n=1 Tax=Posidoniimonas polymericola TaxID=2528002 RepID=A0A5C5YLR0_9BACT|nr:sigma-70 family RNA polymerase sigma factor [Posidoniimonas polymericola]TWT75688.1 ECF RNA polymerase sigma factor SigW [Posidoniimonas polymericola]
MSAKEELFAELFGANQLRLFGYVLGLVRNSADAQDILQQTAVTAWLKFGDFDTDVGDGCETAAATQTNFFRWTATIARHETLNFKRYRRRSRVYFDQELMEQLGHTICELTSDSSLDRSNALTNCLNKLPDGDNNLVECRYAHGLGSLQIAELLGRSQSSVCNSLRRIRENLLRCMQKSLSAES